jgi:tetratricopeptide (TPR) repeat protein
MARTLGVFGRILIEQGEYARAAAVLHENAALAHQIPHRFNPGCPLAQLGEVALARGDWETAQTHLTQALTQLTAETETLYTGVSIAITHTDLAELALVQGDPGQARHELRQVLPYARLYMRRLHCLLVTLAGLLLTPLPTAQTESAQAAAVLLGAIAGLGERTGDTLSPFHQQLIAERSAAAQRLLTQQEWQAAWQQGHAWTPVQAAKAAEQWLGVAVA